jgi:hypothetical protein
MGPGRILLDTIWSAPLASETHDDRGTGESEHSAEEEQEEGADEEEADEYFMIATPPSESSPPRRHPGAFPLEAPRIA